MFRTAKDVQEVINHCNNSPADLAADLRVSTSRILRWQSDGIIESEEPEILDRFVSLEASIKPTQQSKEKYAACCVDESVDNEALKEMIINGLEIQDRKTLERIYFLTRKSELELMIRQSPDLAIEILESIEEEEEVEEE